MLPTLLRAALLASLVLACALPRPTHETGTDAERAVADRDADGVLDEDEGLSDRRDTDRDGRLDAEDQDADGDGVPDATEAGDGDPRTPPVDSDRDEAPDLRDLDSDGDGVTDAVEGAEDTDRDGVLDLRDPDSDGDGLGDGDEVASYGSDPRRADTDGDGASDLVEVAAGTDPGRAADHPRARGDFVFVTPFDAAAEPARDTLRFRTRVQRADVYFLFDRSGSMLGELAALGGAVTTLLGELTCGTSERPCARDVECAEGQLCAAHGRCIEDPALRGCIASPWTGVGHYLDRLTNVVGLQPAPERTRESLRFGVTGTTEALYRAAWGVAAPHEAPGAELACLGSGVGCPGFRPDAIRILVAFTDEDSDGGETALEAGRALRGAGITLVGVWTGTPTDPTRRALEALAAASGSFDRAGRPLVFDGADDAVVPQVRAAIREVVDGVPLRVEIEAEDMPDDDGDALALLGTLEARAEGCTAAEARDEDGDGLDEVYPAVTPGTAVCWDVTPRRNDRIPPAEAPRLLHARVTVRGDGSPLDVRHVYLVVPPAPPQIEWPD